MTSPRGYRSLLCELVRNEARPAHKFGHQARLYELTRQIGEGLAYDDDVVFAAVWLHDLGVFEGNRPSDLSALRHWDHVAYAVQRTRELLPESDFPGHKIPHVVKVIEEHQPRNKPTSVEATIVRDADILEQLGAVAVFRTAAKLGSDTRFARFADARDYLMLQLNQLPEQLQLRRSRELALPRQQHLGDFLNALEAEAGAYIG